MWFCLFVITSVLQAWERRDQKRWISCSCSGKSELWPVIETRMLFVISLKAFHKHSSFLHKLVFPLYLTSHSYVFPVVQYIVGHLFACLHAAAIIFLAFYVGFQWVPEVLAVYRERWIAIITLQSVNWGRKNSKEVYFAGKKPGLRNPASLC